MNISRKTFTVIFLLLCPFFLRAEIKVNVIKNAADLPEPFCSIWKKGDFLISNGNYLILIGGVPRLQKTILNYPLANAMGSILSFVPAGKKAQSTLNIGSPVLRIKNKTDYITYTSVKPVEKNSGEDSLTFECQGSYQGKDKAEAAIKTVYQFFLDEGKILASSTLTNTGAVNLEDLSYYLYFNANHNYYFSPYSRKYFPRLNFRLFQKKGHFLGWLNQNPVEEEGKLQPARLAPGESLSLSYILLVNVEPAPLLSQIYKILDLKPISATIDLKSPDQKIREIIIREINTSTIFFRSLVEESSSLTVPLLEGTYSVRANFFPAVSEKFLVMKPEVDNSCFLEDLPQGAAKVKITSSEGEYVPGKVTFIGLDPTKTPYFRPENPVETGRNWENFKNSCFPPEEGLEVKLPVGTYLVTASHGPEFTLDTKVIEVLKDTSQEIAFMVDKVIETPNLISLDPHLHTQNSDGTTLIPERLKSIVAEGVEVAVASDHNHITDYSPALKKLGLNKYLAVITGSEVTKSGYIHYNTYPQRYRPDEENNGAISPLPDKMSILFNASREKDTGVILQVNHPRAGSLGYFNNYGLDQESAAFAEKDFDLSFDLMEVMNGPAFYWENDQAVEDWFHLLNRGYFFPVIGSSDSHGIDSQEPGYSRTYVLYQGGKGDELDQISLFQALKKGRSFTSNGPLLELKINGDYTFGDTLTAREGKVDVFIEVLSSPWVAVDEVRLIINGERKIVFPVKIQENAIQKFKDQITLTLEKDSWIAAEVLGKRTLYPAVQQRSSEGLWKDASLPYALSNPVFVDVDGNGKFDPPWPEKIKIK